jgi:hypothetical protein
VWGFPPPPPPPVILVLFCFASINVLPAQQLQRCNCSRVQRLGCRLRPSRDHPRCVTARCHCGGIETQMMAGPRTVCTTRPRAIEPRPLRRLQPPLPRAPTATRTLGPYIVARWVWWAVRHDRPASLRHPDWRLHYRGICSRRDSDGGTVRHAPQRRVHGRGSWLSGGHPTRVRPCARGRLWCVPRAACGGEVRAGVSACVATWAMCPAVEDWSAVIAVGCVVWMGGAGGVCGVRGS